MGLFGLFGGKDSSEEKKNERAIPWNELTSIEQLATIEEESKSLPVAIFKHSTSCGISRMVLRNFERGYYMEDEKIKLYYLDLLANRDVSNEVANRFQVLHQSPQLLVIKNGTAVAHESHHSIQAGDLANYID